MDYRKKYDPHEDEQITVRKSEYLYLFRILAIKYKIKYPMSTGKEYKVDSDLMTYLEDKICRSFLKIMESAE